MLGFWPTELGTVWVKLEMGGNADVKPEEL